MLFASCSRVGTSMRVEDAHHDGFSGVGQAVEDAVRAYGELEEPFMNTGYRGRAASATAATDQVAASVS